MTDKLKTIWRWEHDGGSGFVAAADDDDAWNRVIDDTRKAPDQMATGHITWTRGGASNG